MTETKGGRVTVMVVWGCGVFLGGDVSHCVNSVKMLLLWFLFGKSLRDNGEKDDLYFRGCGSFLS